MIGASQRRIKVIAGRRGLTQPPLKVHGMLPGPFLSKLARDNQGYDQCEWYDTRYHRYVETWKPNPSPDPGYRLFYKNFCIWDWDSDPNPPQEQCAMILMWESDGGLTELARGEQLEGGRPLIGPTDIADDFIGFFEVHRKDLLDHGRYFPNYYDNLSILLATENATCRQQNP